MKRRTFVIGGVGAAVVSAGTYAWLRQRGYEVDPRPTSWAGEPRDRAAVLAFAPFDKRALATLTIVVDLLLPGDETLGLPSGGAAGVVDFLNTACRTPGFLPVRNDVLKLMRHMDIVAQRVRGRRFVDLEEADRSAALEEVRRGGDERPTFKPRAALEVLLRLSLEGYLGHPKHGGNKDGTVWKALSIPMPIDVEAGGKGHHH